MIDRAEASDADKRKDRSYPERVLSRAVPENAEHFGIPHFTPHDLRRTAASFMRKLKVPRLHVEKVLNHSTGDIAEVYDRHDYLPEKREALETWAAHLSQIVIGKTHTDDVVELPRAKAGRAGSPLSELFRTRGARAGLRRGRSLCLIPA